MLHFLVGAAYSGKTKALYELTRKLTEQGRRVFFLVPEQQTAQAEADLIRLCSNRAGEVLEVLNFQRLPNRIFREIGSLALPVLSETQKSLLIARILKEREKSLPLFARHRKNADFIRELSAFAGELFKSGTDAEELSHLAEHPALAGEGTLAEKTREAALFLASYRALYEELCLGEPDESTRLFSLLNERNNPFFADSVVILDGFYDFTAPQYDLICHMANTADAVYLSSLDDGRDDLLFERPRTARRLLSARLDGLCDELSPADLGLRERTDTPPKDLVFLCDHIVAAPDAPFTEVPEHLEIVSCKTPYDEVTYALREVVRLHEDEGVPYSECAVLYRDTALYAPLCKELCARYAIPLYTDSRTALSDSVLAQFFTAAASIACGNRTSEPLLRLFSTGLCPFSQPLLLLWERYIRTWDLEGDALYADEAYTASIFGFQEMILPEMRAENEAVLARLNAQKQKLFRPLSRLTAAFEASTSIPVRTEALYRFAEELSVDQTYSALVDALRQSGDFSAAATMEGLFDACREALDALAENETEADDAFFSELLKLSFSFGFVGALPSSPEALAAGDVTFTRLKKVEHLFLLGVCTDVFPRVASSAPLLSPREREVLSRLAGDSPLFFAKPTAELTREEYFLFYLAASVPRRGLHLSYALKALDGSALQPSVFIRRVKALFSNVPCREYSAANEIPFSPAELYEHLVSARNETDPFTECSRRLYRETTDAFLPPSDARAAAERDATLPDESLSSVTVSQAKLSAYTKCPYSYFLHYKLRLAEDPEAKPNASLRGVIIHSALEHLLYPLSQSRRLSAVLDTLTDEKVDAEFALQYRLLSDAGYRFDACDKRWFSDLRQNTRRLLRSMKEELRLGRFVPTLFEADLLRTLTPVERVLKNGCRMRVSGKADRIDLATDPDTGKTYARVVDYKTGEHALDLTAIYNGLDTQLLLYLFTLAENGLGKDRGEILPAAAYYLRAHTPPASAAKNAKAEPDEALCSFERSGIFLDEERALHACVLPGCEAECDDLPVRFDQNGLPKANGLLARGEELNILKDAIFSYAEDVCEDILAGKFPREPLWKDEETQMACTYCPYRSVCRYESEACRLLKKANKKSFFEDLKEGGIHRASGKK